ncbi:MAG: Na(+)/H(+) antiporter subunit B [Vicinamibacterales bacterium]
MSDLLIVAGLIVCAIAAIRAERLLISALWLAGASALTALMMYRLGAPEVAAIELSVGAGLVTVLFVFAINIAGDEPLPARPIVPRPLAWALTLASIAALAWYALPMPGIPEHGPGAARFANVVWEDRNLDVLLQVVLIFAGVVGVVGLLGSSASRGSEEAGR